MSLFITYLGCSGPSSVICIYALPSLFKDALNLLESVQGRHLLVAGGGLGNSTLGLSRRLILRLSTVRGQFSSFTGISRSGWSLGVVISTWGHGSWCRSMVALVLVVLCLRRVIIRLFRVLVVVWIHSDVLYFKFVLVGLVSRRCVVKLALSACGLIT